MSVFVLLNDAYDEKSAILYPCISGPFASEEEAGAFIRKHPRWNDDFGVLEPVDGGYAGAHIVSPETARRPEDVLAEWEELGLEDDLEDED